MAYKAGSSINTLLYMSLPLTWLLAMKIFRRYLSTKMLKVVIFIIIFRGCHLPICFFLYISKESLIRFIIYQQYRVAQHNVQLVILLHHPYVQPLQQLNLQDLLDIASTNTTSYFLELVYFRQLLNRPQLSLRLIQSRSRNVRVFFCLCVGHYTWTS